MRFSFFIPEVIICPEKVAGKGYESLHVPFTHCPSVVPSYRAIAQCQEKHDGTIWGANSKDPSFVGTHTLARVCVRGYVPTFISTYSINLLTCTDLRNHRHRLNYKTVLLQRPLCVNPFSGNFLWLHNYFKNENEKIHVLDSVEGLTLYR